MSTVVQQAQAGKAAEALTMLAKVEPDKRAAVVAAIGQGAHSALAFHLPSQIPSSPVLITGATALFNGIADTQITDLTLVFEKRFELGVKSKKRTTWDAPGLRRTWNVFATLPPDQVAKNWALGDMQQQESTKADGTYEGDSVSLDYTNDRAMNSEYGGVKGDALYKVNWFDEVARHEIGHSVDREMGYPSKQLTTTSAEAGLWVEADNNVAELTALASGFIAASGGPISKLTGPPQQTILNAMLESMKIGSYEPFRAAVKTIPGIEGDKTIEVFEAGFGSSPWNSPVAVNGRHIHQAYPGQWVTYNEAAQQQHAVSHYQFRATGEWFAEGYSAFYTPVKGAQVKGEILKAHLPQTYQWFVSNVDNAQAMAKKSNAAKPTPSTTTPKTAGS